MATANPKRRHIVRATQNFEDNDVTSEFVMTSIVTIVNQQIYQHVCVQVVTKVTIVIQQRSNAKINTVSMETVERMPLENHIANAIGDFQGFNVKIRCEDVTYLLVSMVTVQCTLTN